MLSAGLGTSGNADSALSQAPVIWALSPSVNWLNCFASLVNLTALTTWAEKVFPEREKETKKKKSLHMKITQTRFDVSMQYYLEFH